MPNWRTRCTSATSARTGALDNARPVASPNDINALRSIIFGVPHLRFVGAIRKLPFVETHDRVAHGRTPYCGLGPSLVLRLLCAASMRRHRYGRVSRGSTISSTPNASGGAER